MGVAFAETTASTALAPVAAPGAREKALLRFITCGSVDDGKSTLIGRMLYDSQMIADDQLEALDRDSKKFGTQGGALDFALLVDGLAAEREQGITIDVAYRYFHTDKRSFIVADTPGHEQYTRNMATGASTADCAIILIDARKGILPQTRRHSFIVSMLGVRDVALAINKMDLVDYSEARFNEIVAAYGEMAKNLGFRSVTPLPVSALNGDNIASLSERTPWFSGEPLLRYLENLDAAAGPAADAGLRFPVQWVNRPNLDFRGFSGFVASGCVKVGDQIASMPSGKTSTVQRIVTMDGDLPEAVAGQSVTLTLNDEIDASRGDVLVAAGDRPKIGTETVARLLWTAEAKMHPGATYVVKISARVANATIAKIHHLVDIHSFEPKPAQSLALNEIALATIKFDKPMILADYAENRDLGGFILIDRITNETVAFGLIESSSVESQEETTVAPASAPAPRSKWRRFVTARALPSAFSGLCVGFGAVLLGASGETGLLLGVADAALRPLARALYIDYRRKEARRVAAILRAREEQAVSDGGGI